MPLLKRKVFEKAKVPEFLRDDEEVFHCEVTNEIFRDYEEFCERIILVNSMVWSCSMTGRNNLTYTEALESEENARKSLRDFPPQLRVPVLFLVSKTKRNAFTELAEDVWSFAKDRYFVGEIIEACLSTGSWYEAQVLQVMAPSHEIKQSKAEGKSSDPFQPAAIHFRYEVEQASDDNQVFIVEAAKVRRKKGQYTREKNRLFLKQFVQASPEGIWKIKELIVQKYEIRRVTFEEIFDGPVPDFNKCKKQKGKQETLVKYFSKANSVAANAKKDSDNKAGKKNLMEQMKRREEEHREKSRLEKEQRLQAKEIEKQKAKEENHRLSILVKEWNKRREDLELEDHKRLPSPTPVLTKIPENYFGDALMILDFVNSFSEILSTKKYFPGGLSIDLLERALLENEINGPLSDLIILLLNALFNMQNEEAAEMQMNHAEVKVEDGAVGNVTVAEATRFATAAAKWCSFHHGLPLSRMPLDGLTLTEVLRLHLLSSGSRLTESASRWQYQQRGGYMCEDDPGLTLRIEQPHVIQSLAENHVAQLSIAYKLKILSCLTDQILTYADARDIVEDRLDRSRQVRIDLKVLQVNERKRELEFSSLRSKITKDCKRNKKETPTQAEMFDREFEVAMNKLQIENEKKLSVFNKKSNELLENTRLSYLGLDRAYRRYIFVPSIPALFVENDEANPGSCLEKIVVPNPQLCDALPDQTIEYIKHLYVEKESSNDKENDVQIQKLSPKKNGVNKSLTVKREGVDMESIKDLLMCTGNGTDCWVHSRTVEKVKWAFFYKKDDITNLISSLNKRGIRESQLQQTLEHSKNFLEEQMEMCPAEKLSSLVKLEFERPVKKYAKTRYENPNLNFELGTDLSEILEFTLRDYILDLERHISSGGLGSLHVEDKDVWRNCLKDRNYDLFRLRTIVNGTTSTDVKNQAAEKISNGSRSSTPEVVGPTNGVCDPGTYLRNQLELEKTENSLTDEVKQKLMQGAIIGLATALQSVAYSVNDKYLNRPLGHADKKNNKKKKDDMPHDILSRWNSSLMLSTSFSQLLLHYSTLESSVALHKSALNARCFTCRRRTDDDQLLLCDGCNRGQHLYCIEPKLLSVPIGDWFCNRCQPLKSSRETRSSRKRRIFSEASDDEQPTIMDHDSEFVQQNSSDTDESDDETMESVNEIGYEVCDICKEGGSVVCCDTCSKLYHPECLDPPLRRIPRGSWFCPECKRKELEEEAKRSRAQRMENRNTDRDSSSGGEDGMETPSSTKGSNRRSRRALETCDDLPLHNAPLQELLSDVLKHDDAWPFTQPVQKRDVPDYFEVITHPMDFGTIKYKLNMGRYQYDAELMADAMLVFDNCNTYNDSDATVYKCGVKLLKFFKHRAKELGLSVPNVDSGLHEDAADVEEDSSTPSKRARTR